MFVIERENVGVFQPSVGMHRWSGQHGHMEACELRLCYAVDCRFGVRCHRFWSYQPQTCLPSLEDNGTTWLVVLEVPKKT